MDAGGFIFQGAKQLKFGIMHSLTFKEQLIRLSADKPLTAGGYYWQLHLFFCQQ
jgi:hypothetical protein